MGTPARVVIAAPLPRLPLTAVAPARTRAPNTALVLAAIILDARSVESTSPASIRRAVERSIARSIDRAIAPSRPRALAPSFHRSRLDARGGHGDDDRGGVAITGPDSSRCLHVATRLIFITHRDGTPIRAGRIHMHTHIEPISFGRSIAIAPIPRRSRASRDASDAFRRDGRTRWRARGRRETTTGDGRRETRDERRETRDGRRETRDARGDDVRLDVSTREAVGRGERTASVRFFHARVWARGRDSFAGHHSSLVVGDDSHGFEESSRRISTSPTRGGGDLCRAVSGVF